MGASNLRATRFVFAQRYRCRSGQWALLVLLTTLLTGCTPTTYDDPISVMLDRTAEYRSRRLAADQARRELYRDDRRAAALQRIVWEPGYPSWQRCDAVNQLVELSATRFRTMARRRLTQLDDWPTIRLILDLAVANRWTNFTPAVVRQYARQAHAIGDDQRPERLTLSKLNPHISIEQVVYEVLIGHGHDDVSLAERVAAWELLNRLVSPDRVGQLLGNAPATTTLIADLQACARQLGTWPTGREGVLWLAYLRDPTRRALWQRAVDVARQLPPSDRGSVSLRHIGMLARLGEDRLAMSDDQLVTQMTRYMTFAEHHGDDRHAVSPQVNPGVVAGPPFDSTLLRLGWADLTNLSLVCEGLKDPHLTESLFEQADADRLDTTTEHGGVLDLNDSGQVVAVSYPPQLRAHDRRFVPPPEMIEHLYAALAHYHFHAQDHDNRAYARPGSGDLKLAKRLPAMFVILTFVDQNRLNVDVHLPDGVVLDLGTIYRPSAESS